MLPQQNQYSFPSMIGGQQQQPQMMGNPFGGSTPPMTVQGGPSSVAPGTTIAVMLAPTSSSSGPIPSAAQQLTQQYHSNFNSGGTTMQQQQTTLGGSPAPILGGSFGGHSLHNLGTTGGSSGSTNTTTTAGVVGLIGGSAPTHFGLGGTTPNPENTSHSNMHGMMMGQLGGGSQQLNTNSKIPLSSTPNGSGANGPLSSSGGPSLGNSGGGGGSASRVTNNKPFFYKNLYISSLPAWVDDDLLYSLFSPYGNVRSAKVMLDVRTGDSRGFAFVLFEKEEQGCGAFSALNGKLVSRTLRAIVSSPTANLNSNNNANSTSWQQQDGHHHSDGGNNDGGEAASSVFALRIGPSQHDGRNALVESSTIYVRNIPSLVSDDEITNYFSKKCGSGSGGGGGPNITGFASRSDTSNPTGNTKLATIEFKTVAMAKEAIQESHGKKVFLQCVQPILCKFAESSEVKEHKRLKKVQLQRQSAQQATAPTVSVKVGCGYFSTQPPPPPLSSSHRQQQETFLSSSPGNLPQQPMTTAYLQHSGGGQQQVILTQQQQPPSTTVASPFPGQVPLPVEQRPGFQQLYYQGVLGLTPDGRLYPMLPIQQCQYLEVGHHPMTATTGGSPNANNTYQTLPGATMVSQQGVCPQQRPLMPVTTMQAPPSSQINTRSSVWEGTVET